LWCKWRPSIVTLCFSKWRITPTLCFDAHSLLLKSQASPTIVIKAKREKKM
jgi:hypothetical protein